MRWLTHPILFLLAAASLTGCTGNAEERALRLMETVAETAEAHTGKCEAMAKALDELLTDRKKEIDSVRAIRTGKSEAERNELERQYRPRREAAVERTYRAMRGCTTIPEMARALSRL